MLSRKKSAPSPCKISIASPFKDSEPAWPFRRLSTIGDDPANIRADVAHTYAIVGWGRIWQASSLLLLVRLRVFTGRSLQIALDDAYVSFREFVHRNGKTTSITNFSMQTLKIESPLV